MLSRNLLGADVNETNVLGQAALHVACMAGSVVAVKCLLDLEACNVNLPDQDGNTPLHLACIAQRISVLRVLLQSPRVLCHDVYNKRGQVPFDISMQSPPSEESKSILICWRQHLFEPTKPVLKFCDSPVPESSFEFVLRMRVLASGSLSLHESLRLRLVSKSFWALLLNPSVWPKCIDVGMIMNPECARKLLQLPIKEKTISARLELGCRNNQSRDQSLFSMVRAHNYFSQKLHTICISHLWTRRGDKSIF
jgi:hypothetical protein